MNHLTNLKLETVSNAMLASGRTSIVIGVDVRSATASSVKRSATLAIVRSPRNNNVALVAVHTGSFLSGSEDYVAMGAISLHNFSEEVRNMASNFMREKFGYCRDIDFLKWDILAGVDQTPAVEVFVKSNFQWHLSEICGQKIIVRLGKTLGVKST